MLLVLTRRRLSFSSSSHSSPYSSSDTESAYVKDDEARESRLVLRRLPLGVDEDGECLNPAMVAVSLSNDDICFNPGALWSASLFGSLAVAGGGRLESLLLVYLFGTKLKFLSLESVDVSERALRAGEGGVRSGRANSCTGAFQ